MNAYNGTIATVKGTYQTMFFVKGYYNPGNPSSNSAAQFCRSCHGGESNELHNEPDPDHVVGSVFHSGGGCSPPSLSARNL